MIIEIPDNSIIKVSSSSLIYKNEEAIYFAGWKAIHDINGYEYFKKEVDDESAWYIFTTGKDDEILYHLNKSLSNEPVFVILMDLNAKYKVFLSFESAAKYADSHKNVSI